MNRVFIAQLHRNLGTLQEYLYHTKSKDEAIVVETLKLLERMVKLFPRTELDFDEKFNQIEKNIEILCPIDYRYVFALIDKEKIIKFNTTLNPGDFEGVINKLINF